MNKHYQDEEFRSEDLDNPIDRRTRR